MTGNIRLRLESIWSGCAAHARLRGLVVVCDGMALNSSHNLCSTFLLFFFFLFVCSILHLCGERRKEIIFSREKNDERRSEKKNTGDSFKLSTTYGTLAIKKIPYIQMCLRTHSTIFHRLMFRLVEWRIGADASYDF